MAIGLTRAIQRATDPQSEDRMRLGKWLWIFVNGIKKGNYLVSSDRNEVICVDIISVSVLATSGAMFSSELQHLLALAIRPRCLQNIAHSPLLCPAPSPTDNG